MVILRDKIRFYEGVIDRRKALNEIQGGPCLRLLWLCRSEVTGLSGRDLGLLFLWRPLHAAGHLPPSSGTWLWGPGVLLFVGLSVMVRLFAFLTNNILAGKKIVIETRVFFLFPDLYWNIASSVFIWPWPPCADNDGHCFTAFCPSVQGKEPSVRQLALLHFRNTIVLSVKLDDALSRPRARVPPSVTQMLLILQVGVRWHQHTKWHSYCCFFFSIAHTIICNRADTQKLVSASQMISSVQIMEFISKKCKIKCIIKCNIRLFLSQSS